MTSILDNTTNIYAKDVTAASPPSAVSWAAIFAGAATSAILSLIMLILGTGLGMASVSPWSNAGVSGTTFGVSTIIWITLASLIASAAGGYIAGRLRTKWTGTRTDEVYFRDTAHGFLAWAIATLATATLLTSVVNSIVNSGVQASASMVGGIATAATTVAGTLGNDTSQPMPYLLDSLFRKNFAAPNVTGVDSSVSENTDSKSEVARIFMNAMTTEALPPEDVSYVGLIVAQRTGLSQQEAEKRVTDTFNTLQTKLRGAETAVKVAADKTRKATAYGSLWLFISLLVGAFFSSWMATYGGRLRDL